MFCIAITLSVYANHADESSLFHESHGDIYYVSCLCVLIFFSSHFYNTSTNPSANTILVYATKYTITLARFCIECTLFVDDILQMYFMSWLDVTVVFDITSSATFLCVCD